MRKAVEVFADVETSQRTMARLEAMAGFLLPDDFPDLFTDCAEPDLALTNLERWLATTSSPHLHLQQFLSLSSLARMLIMIFGASQPLTDSLIQNPELASVVLDPHELGRQPTVEKIVGEGQGLLGTTTSPSHALDRLRFLKQRWTLPLVINDLAGTWPEETVWQALSDLAEALIQLTVEAVWAEFARTRQIEGPCPVLVIGFGKLGGRELNYSSDIDLAYAIPDGMGEEFERDTTRFCELLGRAFSDRMGRGQIYRVDMRLRPYGSAGPLVASMRSFEAYYRLYAEQWEVQALIRSRPMAGPVELRERWAAMRVERCFRPNLSEPELEAMLAMKTRIEERADAEDLKRGAGGIRDVEFLAQALQLIHGHRVQDMQAESTLDVLKAAENHVLLDHAVATSLAEGYAFLRQVEHRCQLVGDRQTHSIPSDDLGRRRLAKLMSLANWGELQSKLDGHRRTIQTLYKSILQPEPMQESNRAIVAERLGFLAPSVLQWFDALPSADAFYASLAENRDSIDRVQKIALASPRLVNELKSRISLTEMLISGEIEEEVDLAGPLRNLPLDAPIKMVADAYARARTTLFVRWTLTPDTEFEENLSSLVDALIDHCAKRLFVRFDIVGLGSLGAREMSIESDGDLIFLIAQSSEQSEAEAQAQQLLALMAQLKRQGAPIAIDLRLRPDGGKGMLVRSFEAFGTYDLEGMEMWERFALGQSRLIHGDPASEVLVRKAAYAQPLTPERLRELLAMKKRVETERVKPQHQRRDVKLGWGGLNDIEWTVHLHEMRFPTATMAGESVRMPERIRTLGRAALLNAVEVEQLLNARLHLQEVRLRLGLLGLEKDILPENPDKLDRLAESMGIEGGNTFLAQHEQTIDTVRAIYQEGLERLRA